MNYTVWEECAEQLKQELSSQQFNTWIRPLVAEVNDEQLSLIAPNRFILDWVNQKFLRRIHELVANICVKEDLSLRGEITVKVNKPSASLQATVHHGAQEPITRPTTNPSDNIIQPTTVEPVNQELQGARLETQAEKNQSFSRVTTNTSITPEFDAYSSPYKDDSFETRLSGFDQGHDKYASAYSSNQRLREKPIGSVSNDESVPVYMASSGQNDNFAGGLKHDDSLNTTFTFESFVEGKSNQLGLAAAQQVVENPGESYNPLFIYGGVGLGKTHLMQAVGNAMRQRNPNAKILYLHSERFLADMVKAMQLNAINDFKRYYRSVDALLIDDIQFFSGKDRTQEEFFHTFNALVESNRQIILTCDRYPKAIANLEERLKSRFGWGLTVEVEPPELETRVAILMKRAEKTGVDLPYDAAFFIAQKIRSNVRELEGALKRVVANANFTHRPITVELVREALKDLLALQDKQVNITNIQRVVGEYYKIKVAEFTSKRRSRSVARPRQMAMALAKELTNHSLPEIGDAFGGRDHTTVLHAVRKIKELCGQDSEMEQDWLNLQRTLTT